MAKKKPQISPRAARREGERAAVKLADAGAKLARLEPGGSPENPIELESASLVEPHASSLPCARCGGNLRVEEHTAQTIDGARLRVARLRCVQCGSPRIVYVHLISPLPN